MDWDRAFMSEADFIAKYGAEETECTKLSTDYMSAATATTRD